MWRVVVRVILRTAKQHRRVVKCTVDIQDMCDSDSKLMQPESCASPEVAAGDGRVSR